MFFARTFSPIKWAAGPPPLRCAMEDPCAFHLRLVDIVVDDAGFHQFVVSALGDDPAGLQHQDRVGARVPR